MSEQITLQLQQRSVRGTNASRRLRRVEHMIPGVLYGEAGDTQSVMISDVEFGKALQEESFFSQVLNAELDGEQIPTVVKDLQRHPASNRVLHFDLLRISEDNEIQVSVPLHFLNEETCIGVKLGGGNIARSITELEIRCLPKHLPEYIEVDLAEVEAGQTIHLSDLSLPEGVEFLHATDHVHDSPVVSITTRRGGKVDEDEEDADEGDEEQEAA
ncbi:MAG: 50S ribosomal protein L25/general stress protein Ctc [Gammaproteobacteria bacterium]|nr:50S ribosomal protein L25/general stress protein Ctc [Gammaproteobacteria bacterium]MCY4200262.1 50S ribosomal protein L25/general stress protein Ctc [Gammaproteobacteria bacterium]